MEAERRDMVAQWQDFLQESRMGQPRVVSGSCQLSANGYDFGSRYGDGLASYREKCIMDVLLREGSMRSKNLKRLAGFDGDGLKIFDTIMTTQQMQTYVTVHSFEYACDKIELWGDKNDQF